MIESPWQCKLTQRPNMAKLIERGHVSKAALRVKDYLTRVKGWEIQQELVIPNVKPKNNPYMGDFFIVEKNLIIELDGYHHTPSKKAQEDTKDGQIRDMGSDVIRIPFIIPSHLVYGHLRDPEWSRVKDEYHHWFDTSFCPQILLAIMRWEMSKLKVESGLVTPR